MADPLSVAGSVVGIIALGTKVTQFLVDYYTASRSQHFDVVDTARRLDSLLETLESLRKYVDDRKSGTADESSVTKIESLVEDSKECIMELQEEADKFKDFPIDSVQSAVRKTARRLAYPFRKSTLEKLDEDIDEIMSHLGIALQRLQQEDIDRVKDDTQDIKALLDLVRSSQLSWQLRDWLKAPDATINFNEVCKKKHPRTGLWLVQGEDFRTWLEAPQSFLWLRGFAGCGKSVLCSTAIQYAFRYRRADPRTGIAFFFFTFNDKGKQDTSAMLRALVLQLSSQLSTCNDLARLHDSYRHASPPDEALLNCLHQLIKGFRDVYILLDVLDESPRGDIREAMLQTLMHMRTWEESGLHILVTSRDEVDIRDELDAKLEETVEMKNQGIDRDIAAFIVEHLRKNKRLKKWQKYYDRIEEVLRERANGVFRWVECQFRELASCPANQHLLNKLLQSLPKSLDETYARMLMNIEPDLREYARQMLTVLCYAIRPLTELELIDAIAVELGDNPRFDAERRFDDVSALQTICPGFTEIDVDLENQEATVRIAHYSVQEYLESERILHKDVAQFHVRKQDAHNDIASVCLALLLEPQVIELGDRDSINKKYPLATYAAQYWPRHIAEGISTINMERQILELFQCTEGAFSAWIRIWDVDHNGVRRDRTGTPIYYAALLGLTKTLGQIIDDHHSVNQLTSSEPMLVDYVNAQGGFYGTALQAASARGHEAIVERLLQEGADINIGTQESQYGTALQAASAKGYRAIVERLLQEGADINAQGEFYGTALQAASAGGYRAIVERLLQKGADINAQGGYGTALIVALVRGDREIVERLLQKGADVNAQGGYFGTALQAASARGDREIVERLLQEGADINAQGGFYGTALQAASARGDREIVERLLQEGADINAQGGHFGTALHAASARSHGAIVERFIKEGADCNMQTHHGETPLYVASREGNTDVVKLLLDKGADWTVKNEHGSTPVHVASSSGNVGVVQLLLKKGVDALVKDNLGRPPLYSAIRDGHNEAFHLLAAEETKVNTRDYYGTTAISVAVRCGRKQIVEHFLAVPKIDVGLKDSFGRTPLWWARKQGHIDIVDHLLDYDKSLDLNVSEADMKMGDPAWFSRFDACVYCDVCLASVDDYYLCPYCCGGDFVVCPECRALGAHCLVESHNLTWRGYGR